ncbi:MAG: hypothetical protein JXR19_05510 [Bacteroidia bacterium]
MLLLIILLAQQSYRVGTWRTNRSIIHDITSYYSYLPAAFIYDDFQFEYRYELPQDEPIDHLWVNTRGDTVFQKMSVGLSYFYLPTFLPAHWYTKNFTDYNANGFSKPYQMALNINTLLFGVMGLVLCWLLCMRLFTDQVAAVSLILLYAGSNLLYYIAGAPGLSHPYSFLLITLLYLISLSIFKNGANKKSIFLLAFTVGLIVLVRPTNAILCLFPILYGLQKERKGKTLEILKRPVNWLILIVAFLIPWFPQFAYWKYATGSFLFYSYDQEGFFFAKSHFMDGLFSYRKGWLLYTPLMFLAIVGLFVNKSFRGLKRPLIIILPLFVFVVFSWWCWWYGGSFGSRVMIDTYPLLLVGLGGFVGWVLKMKWWKRIPFLATFLFVLILNLNQTWQYTLGMLHWDSMSKKAYWSIFLKDKPPSDFQELLVHPDYKKAMEEGE